MDTVLLVAGAVLLVVGIVMVPFPGPGLLVLWLGVVLLAAGALARLLISPRRRR
ncbi:MULTISPECIES: PGPGW domain-containing protein [Arsenicicoccus]|uniref:PGPGW domain-containing protein n=1 Tax=Arsenicicoccus TaxID=267408 RepID=UPI00257DBA17|nr:MULTISPECIES: PGPGW domain-containing protein [Arsenicicoccus]